MSEKEPQDMTANEFKRRYRTSSGWPNVQREWEDRQENKKEDERTKAMLKAGARITKRTDTRS